MSALQWERQRLAGEAWVITTGALTRCWRSNQIETQTGTLYAEFIFGLGLIESSLLSDRRC